jgi:hypothetical protein
MTKSRRGHTGFQFMFSLVLKSPLLLCKFDVTAICFHEIQWIPPLLLWNTLHENNPLPPAPNVCVSEVFNYTDFTKVAILWSDTEKLGIHCIVLDCFSIFFINLKLRYFQMLLYGDMLSVWIYGRLMNNLTFAVTRRSFVYVSHLPLITSIRLDYIMVTLHFLTWWMCEICY